MERLIDRVTARIALRGWQAEVRLQNVYLMGDLWWDRRPAIVDEAELHRDPAILVASSIRYVAMQMVGTDLRYLAAPLLVEEWGFRGYRDGDGNGGPIEMGTFATLDDAMEFERRYLGGEAFEQIDVSRTLAPHLVAIRERERKESP